MPTIGGASRDTVRSNPTVVIEVREKWDDDHEWQIRSDLIPIRDSWGVSEQTAQFSRRYGPDVKLPGDEFTDYLPDSLLGYWVRIRYQSETGSEVVWQGVVYDETYSVHGASGLVGRGTTTYIARGPSTIAQKKRIWYTYWGDDPMHWLPHFNLSSSGKIATNRTLSTNSRDAYSFGSDATWTHLQALDHVLNIYMQQWSGSERVGPTYTIGGQTDILSGRTSPIVRNASSMWLSDMIAQIIDPATGIDYVWLPTSTGYELRVFALQPFDYSWGGVTLPKNPDSTIIDTLGDQFVDDSACEVHLSERQRYDSVYVIGERIVVCGSGTAIDDWSGADEIAYESGAGSDPSYTALDHDRARSDDRFWNVYQRYAILSDELTPPRLDTQGAYLASDGYIQTDDVSTLPVLPLYAGVDYTVYPPSGSGDELLPPFAVASINGTDGSGYIMADRIGHLATIDGASSASISPLPDALGLHVACQPNHLLAAFAFDDTRPSETDPIGVMRYITIARRSDTRLALEFTASDADDSGRGESMVVEAPGCECWYLMPETILGVDPSGGTLKRAPNQNGMLIRNDADKMAAIAAGAMARYLNSRGHAVFAWRLLESYVSVIGSVLTGSTDTVLMAGTANMIITTIEHEYTGDLPRTMLKAGSA